MNQQDATDALNRYQAYLKEDPNNTNLLLSIGLLKANLLHHQHAIEEAIEVLNALIETHGLHEDVAGLLALLHFDDEQLAQADFFSNQALRLNEAHKLGRLVALLLRTHRQEATPDDIKAHLAIQPNEARLWFALGTTELRDINITAAEKAFREACAIGPESIDHWIALGWVCLLQHDIESAQAAYQTVVTMDANNADGWGGLAVLCCLKQDNAKACLERIAPKDNNALLPTLARFLLTNPINTNPDRIATAFQQLLPDVVPEIRRMLSNAVWMMSTEHGVLQ